MTKTQILEYARFIAVGEGNLTRAMADRLSAGDAALAVKIMSERIRDLQNGKASGIVAPLTTEDIDSMIDSVRQAIAQLSAITPEAE